MLRKMRAKVTLGTQGFTLIELMIVIAIIGILAAIAIPNFIAYRNKAFCSGTESDANSIAADISSYFAIPANRTVSGGNLDVRALLSNENTWSIASSIGTSGDAETITITVTDATGRCPADYRTAMGPGNDPFGYWSGSTYIKIMSL